MPQAMYWWAWWETRMVDKYGLPIYATAGPASSMQDLQGKVTRMGGPGNFESDQFPTRDETSVKHYIRPRISAKHGVEAGLSRRFRNVNGGQDDVVREDVKW